MEEAGVEGERGVGRGRGKEKEEMRPHVNELQITSDDILVCTRCYNLHSASVVFIFEMWNFRKYHAESCAHMRVGEREKEPASRKRTSNSEREGRNRRALSRGRYRLRADREIRLSRV